MITETDVVLKENGMLEALNYDTDVLCPLQWGLLWFSAPSGHNRKFVNNGTKVAKFSAIELTCNIAIEGTHTPQERVLRAVSIFLSYAPDKDWNLEEEMKVWGVADSPLSTPSAVRGSATD